MALKLRGGRNRHIMLTITSEDYMAQTSYTFVPPHKTGNYPSTTGNAQEQVLGTKRFQKNQALFRRFIVVDRALKKQKVTVAQPVFMFPLVEQFAWFGQVTTTQMLQHLLYSYGAIEKIDLEDNALKVMGSYDPADLLARLIDQL